MKSSRTLKTTTVANSGVVTWAVQARDLTSTGDYTGSNADRDHFNEVIHEEVKKNNLTAQIEV